MSDIIDETVLTEAEVEEQRQEILTEKDRAVALINELVDLSDSDNQGRVYRCYMDMLTVNRMLSAIVETAISKETEHERDNKSM